MARKTIGQRITELEERKKALVARLGKQDRARDTRRKILLGAFVLHRLENSNDFDFTRRISDWLRKELPGFLTRDGDKDLFHDILLPASSSEGMSTGNPE